MVRTHRIDPVFTPTASDPGEQESRMPVLPPLGPQESEQLRGGGDEPILTAFAAPNVNAVLRRLHVAGLEIDRLGDPPSVWAYVRQSSSFTKALVETAVRWLSASVRDAVVRTIARLEFWQHASAFSRISMGVFAHAAVRAKHSDRTRVVEKETESS